MEAPKAKVAVLMLTPRCDMSCPYCGSGAAFHDMGENDARRLVVDLAEQGFENVVFGGGEPFCWNGDLRALAGFAKKLGMITQVGSNLRRLPLGAPQWEEVDRWVIPFESASSAAHDALRPGNESHQAIVLRALQAFSAAGANVTISSVARHNGETDLRSVGDLLHAWTAWGLKLHAWHIYRFQAEGRNGSKHAAEFSLSDEDWKCMVDGVRARHPELPVLLRPDLYHSKQVAFFWAGAQGFWRQGPLQWSGPALPAAKAA